MDLVTLRNLLDEKIKSKSKHLTKEEISRLHHAYIDYHAATKPDEIFVIPMEEMAELTQHLSKIIRGKETPADLGFLEELADVQICIDNLRIACNVDTETFDYIKDIKFERAAKKMKAGNA